MPLARSLADRLLQGQSRAEQSRAEQSRAEQSRDPGAAERAQPPPSTGAGRRKRGHTHGAIRHGRDYRKNRPPETRPMVSSVSGAVVPWSGPGRTRPKTRLLCVLIRPNEKKLIALTDFHSALENPCFSPFFYLFCSISHHPAPFLPIIYCSTGPQPVVRTYTDLVGAPYIPQYHPALREIPALPPPKLPKLPELPESSRLPESHQISRPRPMNMPSVQDLTQLLASTPENLSPSHSSSCLQILNGHHTHPNHFDYSLPTFSDLRGLDTHTRSNSDAFSLFERNESSSSLGRRASASSLSISGLSNNGVTSASNLPITEEDEMIISTDTTTPLEPIHEPSPIERLPIEVLSKILYYVNDSATPMTSSRFMLQTASGSSAYYTHIAQFAKILTTSWSFYNAGTPLLYIHVSFSHSNTFAKFLKSIKSTGYGHFVRCIDLADFTSVGLGRTARMNMEIQNLTSTTLLQLLDLCPNLFEFLASESIELDLSEDVCKRLLCLPHLRALDLCGATNENFTHALVKAVTFFDALPAIRRLSLHGCSTLPSSLFENLLPKLPHLTHLDLTHTQIMTPGLLSICQTTPLQYLSLSRCIKLTSAGILQFFLKHQASRNLTWLNLMCDATRPSIINTEDLETIMNHLPTTLTNINLYGLPVTEHMFESYIVNNPPFLQYLAALSLGYCDISPNCLKKNLPLFQSLSYLDLTGNSHINIWSIQDQDLLNANPNITCFEFSSPILTKLASGMRINGFTITLGQGHRAWLFRGVAPLAHNVQRMRQLQQLKAEEEAEENNNKNNNTSNGNDDDDMERPLTPTVLTSSPFSFGSKPADQDREQRERFTEGYLRYNAPPTSASNVRRFDTVYNSNNNSNSSSRSTSRRRLMDDIYQPSKEPANVMASSGDMANRYWNKASRKINVCMVGNGGHNTTESRQQRGIYLYYAFRR